MGWLDKTFKNIVKSPVGKAALLGAGAYFGGPGIAGLLGKAGGTKAAGTLASLWAKPLISKPLTNAAMSYGLAKLMRSRNPEKAAMWGALSTLPFLGASSMKHAKTLTDAGQKTSMWDVLLNRQIPMSGYGTGAQELFAKNFDKLSDLEKMRLAQMGGFKGGTQATLDQLAKSQLSKGIPMMDAAKDYSYFMKSPTELAAMEKAAANATGLAQFMPRTSYDLLRTGLPLMAGVYGGRETDAQAWERKRKQRIQQLAWMYGVDPSMITGEMTNPWYDNTPPALDWKYANQGGIMNLDAGGDVSGPGTGTSDSINAKLSDGEFVMTAKAVENLGGGDRQAGARRMYSLMNQLDPQSQTAAEGMA